MAEIKRKSSKVDYDPNIKIKGIKSIDDPYWMVEFLGLEHLIKRRDFKRNGKHG